VVIDEHCVARVTETLSKIGEELLLETRELHKQQISINVDDRNIQGEEYPMSHDNARDLYSSSRSIEESSQGNPVDSTELNIFL
jgi:hypothetical protein